MSRIITLIYPNGRQEVIDRQADPNESPVNLAAQISIHQALGTFIKVHDTWRKVSWTYKVVNTRAGKGVESVKSTSIPKVAGWWAGFTEHDNGKLVADPFKPDSGFRPNANGGWGSYVKVQGPYSSWAAAKAAKPGGIVNPRKTKRTPKPKFQIGDRVCDLDGGRPGTVGFIGSWVEGWEPHLTPHGGKGAFAYGGTPVEGSAGYWTYKVQQDSGPRHTRNEPNLRKLKKSEEKKPAKTRKSNPWTKAEAEALLDKQLTSSLGASWGSFTGESRHMPSGAWRLGVMYPKSGRWYWTIWPTGRLKGEHSLGGHRSPSKWTSGHAKANPRSRWVEKPEGTWLARYKEGPSFVIVDEEGLYTLLRGRWSVRLDSFKSEFKLGRYKTLSDAQQAAETSRKTRYSNPKTKTRTTGPRKRKTTKR